MRKTLKFRGIHLLKWMAKFMEEYADPIEGYGVLSGSVIVAMSENNGHESITGFMQMPDIESDALKRLEDTVIKNFMSGKSIDEIQHQVDSFLNSNSN